MSCSRLIFLVTSVDKWHFDAGVNKIPHIFSSNPLSCQYSHMHFDISWRHFVKVYWPQARATRKFLNLNEYQDVQTKSDWQNERFVFILVWYVRGFEPTLRGQYADVLKRMTVRWVSAVKEVHLPGRHVLKNSRNATVIIHLLWYLNKDLMLKLWVEWGLVTVTVTYCVLTTHNHLNK